MLTKRSLQKREPLAIVESWWWGVDTETTAPGSMEVIESKILKVTLFTVKYKSEAEINHLKKNLSPNS